MKKLSVIVFCLCVLFLAGQVILWTAFRDWQVRNGDPNFIRAISLAVSVCYLLCYLILNSRIWPTLKWIFVSTVILVCSISACTVIKPLDTTTEPYDIELLGQSSGGEKILIREYTNAKTNRIIRDTIIALDVLFFRKRSRYESNHQNDSIPANDTLFLSTRDLHSDKIPNSLFERTGLEALGVRGMDCDYGSDSCWMLKEIPSAISKLKNVRKLAFPLNAITRLPSELAELPLLESLDMTDNATLADIAIMPRLKGLKELYLYGCHLRKLPDSIGDLQNLRDLGLVGNSFSDKEKARIKSLLPKCRILFDN